MMKQRAAALVLLVALFGAEVRFTAQSPPCPALAPSIKASLVLTSAETAALEGACERIPALRQGDVTITLVDLTGRPIQGLAVGVDQTRHAFLFGGQPNEIARGILSPQERARFDELFLAVF